MELRVFSEHSGLRGCCDKGELKFSTKLTASNPVAAAGLVPLQRPCYSEIGVDVAAETRFEIMRFIERDLTVSKIAAAVGWVPL